MPNNVETSVLEAKDSTDHDDQNGVLRNRLGNSIDLGEAKRANINETTIETPPTSTNEAGLDNYVEYVKGHPVIKNGEQHILYLSCASSMLTIMTGYDVSRFLVSIRDDEDPSFTFRSILLGTVFTALSSVVTMLYVFKPVQMQVSAVFIQCE